MKITNPPNKTQQEPPRKLKETALQLKYISIIISSNEDTQDAWQGLHPDSELKVINILFMS